MRENTKLWDMLGRTDPKHTKAFTRGGGFKGTAIKPIWSYLRMTEEFGACGTGWGVNPPTFDVQDCGEERLVFCTASIWYGNREQVCFGVGGDKVIGKNKFGLSTDDEAFKKAYTDAITNALKMIGVGADVHMGLFDDSKYVNTMKQEFSEELEPTKLRDGLKTNKITGRTSANSLKQDKSPDNWDAFETELLECQSVADLTKLALSWSSISERDVWPTSWHNLAKSKINERREELINGVVPDDDVFPGDRPPMTQEQIDYLNSHPVNGG